MVCSAQISDSNFGTQPSLEGFNVPMPTVSDAPMLTLFSTLIISLLPDFGIQPTGEVALKLANDYFKSLGLSDNPDKKWRYLFVERHSED
ncbi:unnamed protein product [Rotaria magnacalcarata]|uniref:Uncharacterized protein n=1 Tax=Rotaria magnacalcarata TaxID=392030 RepID=A0A817AS16_9BILA|nr:unnamed protein product [Rotaria magnacalcarata]